MQMWLLVYFCGHEIRTKQPLARVAYRDDLSASPLPSLICCGDISLTLLIYLSPIGHVPTLLPPQETSSTILFLSTLFMVLVVPSVTHLMNYPHRPCFAI